MSAICALRPRVLRPALSLRYQLLRRAEVTSASAPTTSPPHSTPASPSPKPRGLIRRNRRLIWVSLAFLAGATAFSLVYGIVSPPPLPEPGTKEDAILMADLNRKIDEDFKVKVLRGKCLGVAKQLKGEQGGWVELVPTPEEQDQARNKPEGKQLVKTLEGARGLGVERLFWDRREHTLIAVVWFGGGVSGWPSVTHGGAIATQLSEKLALAAALAGESASSVRAAAAPQRLPGTGNHAKMALPATTPDEPAQLSLSYVKPTYANNFYVIRVAPAAPIDEDPAHIVPSEPLGGHEYEATLETSLGAKICVKAKARFRPSSRTERAEEQVKEVVGGGYEKFREWMWPSRQQSST